MKKLNIKWIFGQLFRKLAHPRRFWQFLKRLRKPERVPTSAENLQLDLYNKILPGDFLHYGYFDDPKTPPEAISLQAIYEAQVRYAELILEQISDRESPVLDAGCGQGGLLKMLLQSGYTPVGLTPDRFQVEKLQVKYADVALLHTRFEEMPVASYQQYFGTVIHSESLQYMRLEDAIAVTRQILKPGGRWIVVDYFRTREDAQRSGFQWEQFTQTLQAHDMKVIYEQDITANVCPTLAYIHMWGNRIGLPVVDFAVAKLERKRPALYYLSDEVIRAAKESIENMLDVVNPDVFAATKKYMLLTIEREA